MNFGKYAILDPVKHTFEKEPTWWWMVRPPDGKDELAVSKLLATDRFRIELDGTRVNEMPTTLEIAMREISATFGGTNIPVSETDPTPILKDNAKVAEVEAVVAQMSREMIMELWKAVGDAVPGWGPAKPAAQKTDATKN